MKCECAFLSSIFPLWSSPSSALKTPLLDKQDEASKTTTTTTTTTAITEEPPVAIRDGQGKGRVEFPLSRSETLAVITLFTLFVAGLITIYVTMPDADRSVFKLPRNIEELRKLTEYLSVYAQDHTPQVLLSYVVSYVFLQTFMIPGTILMSLLAGALFGEYYGLLLVVSTATTGASSCYFLSKLIGRPLVNWLWPDKLAFFRAQVAKRRAKLLNYMLFLRITPTLPNTFINVASPIVDIPFDTFFWATIIGLVPAAFVTVRAGLALGELQSLSDLYDAKTIATLFFIGLVSIVPTVFGNKASKDDS